MSEERFLARWSRRKARSQADPVQDETSVATGRAAVCGAPAPPAPEQAPVEPNPGLQEASSASATGSEATALPDLQSLGIDSDYRPFMQRSVDPGIRNAAMRKLFSDPHFNVMDGLDTYIDDYGKPDPLPAGMLESLRQWQALTSVESPEKDEPEATPATRSAEATADGAVSVEATAEVSGEASEIAADGPLEPSAGVTLAPGASAHHLTVSLNAAALQKSDELLPDLADQPRDAP